MKKFALENHPQIIEKGFLSCLLWFIQRLSFHAHCGGIRIKSAVADEETTPPGVKVFTGPMTGLRQFRVIAITAWEKSAWDHRPTMKQVEVMSQILGMEPQWFTDVTPPEVYLDNDY
ncbi:hypothetical protein CPB84DRAFT_1778657 [Gymnopilus junonius]|uniref:Uncharacterized protein n=1 Tax=Gymnopilus junonius TaxID=109634 RepID=A0A9P5NPD9_GYMJU|nr:hypothetical protein CPB84DRAFT_1778657 [Gymnopilus junonius]